MKYAKYGWIIIRDHGHEQDTITNRAPFRSRVGTVGPHNIHPVIEHRLRDPLTSLYDPGLLPPPPTQHSFEYFRMLDDDENPIYEGWAFNCDHEPLEDFGRADAGCTEIQWRTSVGTEDTFETI